MEAFHSRPAICVDFDGSLPAKDSLTSSSAWRPFPSTSSTIAEHKTSLFLFELGRVKDHCSATLVLFYSTFFSNKEAPPRLNQQGQLAITSSILSQTLATRSSLDTTLTALLELPHRPISCHLQSGPRTDPPPPTLILLNKRDRSGRAAPLVRSLDQATLHHSGPLRRLESTPPTCLPLQRSGRAQTCLVSPTMTISTIR